MDDFNAWYEQYERDGVFNTIDMEAAFEAGRNAERERCAKVAEGIERPADRHWVTGSLYETIRREVAELIRRS